MLVATMGVNNKIADDVAFAMHVRSALWKFNHKDWGESPDEDKKANDWADANTGRIFASYGSGEDVVWIIREADHSATTILFPSDY